MKKSIGKLLQVAQLGHPIIRTKTKSVQDIDSPEIQQLIDDMIATVMEVDGVGIAAPPSTQITQNIYHCVPPEHTISQCSGHPTNCSYQS